MHKKETEKYWHNISLRLSDENRLKIQKKVEAKMKRETRSRNNCLEQILKEYFEIK